MGVEGFWCGVIDDVAGFCLASLWIGVVCYLWIEISKRMLLFLQITQSRSGHSDLCVQPYSLCCLPCVFAVSCGCPSTCLFAFTTCWEQNIAYTSPCCATNCYGWVTVVSLAFPSSLCILYLFSLYFFMILIACVKYGHRSKDVRCVWMSSPTNLPASIYTAFELSSRAPLVLCVRNFLSFFCSDESRFLSSYCNHQDMVLTICSTIAPSHSFQAPLSDLNQQRRQFLSFQTTKEQIKRRTMHCFSHCAKTWIHPLCLPHHCPSMDALLACRTSKILKRANRCSLGHLFRRPIDLIAQRTDGEEMKGYRQWRAILPFLRCQMLASNRVGFWT